eukprot:Opistho-2@94634
MSTQACHTGGTCHVSCGAIKCRGQATPTQLRPHEAAEGDRTTATCCRGLLDLPTDIVERILLDTPAHVIGSRELCALDMTCKPLRPLTERVARTRLVRRSGGLTGAPALLSAVVPAADPSLSVVVDVTAGVVRIDAPPHHFNSLWKRVLGACEARDACAAAERALFFATDAGPCYPPRRARDFWGRRPWPWRGGRDWRGSAASGSTACRADTRTQHITSLPRCGDGPRGSLPWSHR